jgi:hypothetical protein
MLSLVLSVVVVDSHISNTKATDKTRESISRANHTGRDKRVKEAQSIGIKNQRDKEDRHKRRSSRVEENQSNNQQRDKRSKRSKSEGSSSDSLDP